MDLLAIPATSVPVERRFSDLNDIITPSRSSLAAETIQIIHELKGYLKFGQNELLQLIMEQP